MLRVTKNFPVLLLDVVDGFKGSHRDLPFFLRSPPLAKGSPIFVRPQDPPFSHIV